MYLVYNKRSFYTRLFYFFMFFLFLGDHKTPRRMKEMMRRKKNHLLFALSYRVRPWARAWKLSIAWRWKTCRSRSPR